MVAGVAFGVIRQFNVGTVEGNLQPLALVCFGSGCSYFRSGTYMLPVGSTLLKNTEGQKMIAVVRGKGFTSPYIV